MPEPLLEVDGLTKRFPTSRGFFGGEGDPVTAVDDLSFEIGRGETFGLVGESGCGKTTAARALLRIDEPTAGSIRFDGDDVREYDGAERKRFRRRARMTFQNPDSAFDPRLSVGESVAEPLRIHGMSDPDRRSSIVEDLLVRVGLEPNDADRYPHELSGGQKRRAGLARALVSNPELLVADEPTSGLDVSVQAGIVSLLNDLQATHGLSILFISHDLGVVREVCDRVGVMYLGELVEVASTRTLFEDPSHPYTEALVSAIPSPDVSEDRERVRLRGDVPDAANPPQGCRFHTRCPSVIEPDGYSFSDDVWRSVLDVISRIEAGGLTVEALPNPIDPEVAGEDVTGSRNVPSAEWVDAAVRREYDLPSTLSDPDAEATFTAALARLADGDDHGARELLRQEFATVCRERPPRSVEIGPDHVASCHLVDDR